MNIDTGQCVPARCLANTCDHCGPANARLVGGAVTLANVTRFGTLTQVGEDWPTVRARMNRVAYDVRKLTGESSWCWHVEPNPRGTGHHVHFWQRGRFVPQASLSRIAARRGCGPVADIRAWRTAPATAVKYGVKLAGVKYGVKGAADHRTMQGYLQANGGRLVHASRGFWRDRDGEPCGQRAAMRSWGSAVDDGEPGTWVLCREER